jgi:hypothetical protein
VWLTLYFFSVTVSSQALAINAVGTQVNGTFASTGSGTLSLIGASVYLDPTTTISGSGSFSFPNTVVLAGRLAITGSIVITGSTTVQSATQFSTGGRIQVGTAGASAEAGILTFADVATNNVPSLGTLPSSFPCSPACASDASTHLTLCPRACVCGAEVNTGAIVFGQYAHVVPVLKIGNNDGAYFTNAAVTVEGSVTVMTALTWYRGSLSCPLEGGQLINNGTSTLQPSSNEVYDYLYGRSDKVR